MFLYQVHPYIFHVLVSLLQVAGDVGELERALALAPRGQRADWITRVQVDKVVFRIFSTLLMEPTNRLPYRFMIVL